MERSDPLPHEREYYRHATTGDLGYIVRRDGKDCIKMDRGSAPEEIRDFVAGAWVRENQVYPMNRQQLVQVAYEADRKLCFYLGLHKEAKREWRSMKEEERIKWVEKGPRASSLRNHLFAAIMEALKDLAQ